MLFESKVIYITIVVFICMISGCSLLEEDDGINSTETPYLTVEVAEGYYSPTYLIITNDKGDVINHIALTHNHSTNPDLSVSDRSFQISEYKSELTPTIGVYFLNYHEYYSSAEDDVPNIGYSMTGYQSVNVGNIIEVNDYDVFYCQDEAIGTALITIDNHPSYIMSLNNMKGNLIETCGDMTYESVDSNLVYEVKLSQQNDQILLISSSYGDHRYATLDNVNVNDEIFVDYAGTAFLPYDYVAKSDNVDHDIGVVKVRAIDFNTNNEQLIFLTSLLNGGKNYFEVGYINGYDFYKSEVQLPYNRNIRKYGDPLTDTELNFPDFDFEITNSSKNEFEYTYTGEAMYYGTFWGVSTMSESENIRGYMRVYNKTDTDFGMIKEIPDEILEIYPYIDLKDLEYTGATFFNTDYPYIDFVTGSLNDKELSNEYLRYSYYKSKQD